MLRVAGIPFIQIIAAFFLTKVVACQEPSHHFADVDACVVSKSDSQKRNYLKGSVSKHVDKM